MQPKRILYILSGNLSTTPRALQSISETLKNCKITIIGVNRNSQWSNLDHLLVQKQHLDYNTVSLGRDYFFIWLFAGLLYKVCAFMYPLFKNSITASAYSSSKVHILLWNRLKKETANYDLIIGHSGSSLFPVWKYAKRHHIPFIFDVEDYHPGEQINFDASNEKHRREFLLQKLLPDAACVTVASPLIGERIKALVGKGNIKNMVVINNCFPADEFEFITSRIKGENLNRNDNEFGLGTNIFKSSNFQIDKIHFVWFSQNIAANRGLEFIIPALAKVSDQVHLHLIGNLYPGFNQDWVKPNREFITSYPPMPQKELNRFICQFDVGLAFELPTADENRQICLTNKIWAYMQAGLYILATDTPAQVGFMNEHLGHGLICEIDETERRIGATINDPVSEAVVKILNSIETIRMEKKERFERAKEYSWEKENEKLQWMWETILIKQ